MSTTARIRASITVILAVFALLVTSGLAVRDHATSATAGQASKVAATDVVQPPAAPASGEEVEGDGELEAD